MADKLTFELVSPEKLLASLEADMITAPGEEGEFGVLPGHAPFMTTLIPGVIAIYQGDKVEQRIFVEGGFAEINERGCIVLAERAQPVGAIDKTVAEEALKAAQTTLDAAEPFTPDHARLEAEVKVAEARVEATTGHSS